MLSLVLSVLAACGSAQDEAVPKTAFGPEGMAVQRGVLLAPSDPTGETRGGVECRPPAEPVFHVHTHLAIYVDGALRPFPAGIGIVDPGRITQTETGPLLEGPRCYYGVHVHAQDGVIHAEGSSRRPFTLGQFFDVWGQPLSANQVGPARGALTVYVDGEPSRQPPREIPLTDLGVIQIVVGAPVAPQPVDWSHF